MDRCSRRRSGCRWERESSAVMHSRGNEGGSVSARQAVVHTEVDPSASKKVAQPLQALDHAAAFAGGDGPGAGEVA